MIIVIWYNSFLHVFPQFIVMMRFECVFKFPFIVLLDKFQVSFPQRYHNVAVWNFRDEIQNVDLSSEDVRVN